jgi:hypothetical protein
MYLDDVHFLFFGEGMAIVVIHFFMVVMETGLRLTHLSGVWVWEEARTSRDRLLDLLLSLERQRTCLLCLRASSWS